MSSPQSCPGLPRLQEYAQRRLPAPDSQAVEAHLGQCGSCRTLLHALGGLQDPTALTPALSTPTRPLPANAASAAPLIAAGGATLPGGTPRPTTAPAGSDGPFPFLRPPVGPGEIGRLGNYRVLRLLGKGGMAHVFHAEDLALARAVALKVLNPDLAAGADGAERFLREARITAALHHEHLVTVYQVGQEGTAVFLAMELLQGESLEAWLQRVRQAAPADVVRLAREIASGLAVIHERGLLHRDLKPANIWLEGPSGRVKILDFGLARSLNDNTHLTQSGMVMGTPAYMSPEQARGQTLDARSDLFSLGCVLYALCTGRPPFHADTTMAVLTALAVDDPAPVHQINPAIPRPLSDLIMRLLAKRREDRPASAVEVLQCLQPMAPFATTALSVALSNGSIPVAVPVNGATVALGLHSPANRRSLKIGILAGAGAGVFLLGLLIVWGVAGRASPSRTVAAASRKETSPALVEQGRVYLTHLKVVARENWPFEPPPPPPDAPPPPKFDGKVRVKGKDYPHGIFMHPPGGPPGGRASISYSLQKRFQDFQANVTFNDGPPESENPVTFSVYGDGKRLWQSKPVSSQADAQEKTISVKGVDVLQIVVECSGEPRGAHAVWLNPYLTR